MKKSLAAYFLLASVSIFVLASCGSESVDSAVSESAVGTSAETETAAESEDTVRSLLPDNLDFEGQEVRVCNSYYMEGDAFMFDAPEATGDIVNDAIYESRMKVETDLNVRFFTQEFCVIKKEEFAPVIRKSVQAGADEYDLILGVQCDIAREVVNNLFVNLADAEYLHPDQPWWYEHYMKELSVGADRMYFLAGDISIGVLRNMSCMYVNKDLYRQYFGDPQQIYQDVLDGKWTMDVMAEQCAQMYQDLNGNSKPDEEDRYGIGVITENLTDHLTYDSGVRITERDQKNIPYFHMDTEKTIRFMEKLYSLYYENPGAFIFPGHQESIDIVMPNKFNQDELLYLPGWFYTAELMRGMDVDYAVIPYPKCDETEPEYHSLAHDISTIVCMPTTCQIPEAVTASMEALAVEGYRRVLPAYYEVATKIKYTRDSSDTAMQVLDSIHGSVTTDFAYIYSRALSDIGMLPRQMMQMKSRNFVSFYTKREKSAEKRLDKLLDVLTSME